LNFSQSFYAAALVLILLGLAAYFIWRQRQILEHLRLQTDLPEADRRYLRNQARRRLVGSALMILVALLMAGSFLSGLEDRAKELADQADAQRAREQVVHLNPDQKRLAQLWGYYWIGILLLVLGILILAAWDVWAIRRYALRHRRQIQADRREMIEEQIAIYRSQRNGHT
jgi:hypothetical protein